MADDPKYVRLATRLSRGMVCDVEGSGWSISGLDVRQFPEGNVASRFVRSKLNAGLLEPASKSEWEEAHDTSLEDEILSQNPDYRSTASAVQEGRVQRAARAAQEKLASSRDADYEAEADAERELIAKDRQARLDEQAEMDLMTDDPETQKARTAGQTPTRSSKAKKKGARSKASSEEQE